jgi:hypothetical protein
MNRRDVVRIIEEVESELERLDHRLTYQNGILVRLPATVEEKLRELRLALDHDEIFGRDDEGWR